MKRIKVKVGGTRIASGNNESDILERLRQEELCTEVLLLLLLVSFTDFLYEKGTGTVSEPKIL